MKKLKAYIVEEKNGDTGFATVVFAETPGKARQLAQSTDACEDIDFIDIRAIRAPALDECYRGRDEMNWCVDEDLVAMVRLAGFSCSYEIDHPICDPCPAKEWCKRYESINS